MGKTERLLKKTYRPSLSRYISTESRLAFMSQRQGQARGSRAVHFTAIYLSSHFVRVLSTTVYFLELHSTLHAARPSILDQEFLRTTPRMAAHLFQLWTKPATEMRQPPVSF